MSRFQLVFRGGPNGHQTEFRENSIHDEPLVDGRLVVDGERYVIRGAEWLVSRSEDEHGMACFRCTYITQALA